MQIVFYEDTICNINISRNRGRFSVPIYSLQSSLFANGIIGTDGIIGTAILTNNLVIFSRKPMGSEEVF